MTAPIAASGVLGWVLLSVQGSAQNRANLYAKPFASHPRSYHLLADSGRSIVF